MAARAPLLGLYGNVGQIYHSGLTVQFSYLPRAACRSTPNHSSSRGGWSCWWRRSSATGNGDARSGAEAADRGSANTLLPSSRTLILFCRHPRTTNPLVLSVQPTLSTNLPHLPDHHSAFSLHPSSLRYSTSNGMTNRPDETQRNVQPSK